MIKKISEFKDEESVLIIEKLLTPIGSMFGKQENIKATQKAVKEKTPLLMFQALLKNNPREIMDIFAILSEQDPKEYHCNGAEVLVNLVSLANDQDLVQLFMLQA